MTAPAFILGLQERGATLQLEGEALRVTPSTVLTDADRAAWREHKREITTLLEAALSSTRCEVQPGAPPFLVGVSDVEFCATRGAWIRRIGSAVWFVPLLAATVLSQSSTHTGYWVFMRCRTKVFISPFRAEMKNAAEKSHFWR